MSRYIRIAITVTASIMTAASVWAMPVEDINLKNVAPKPGELDIELRSLEQITLTFDATEVIIGEDATASLACPDGTTVTAPLVRNKYMKNVVLLDFPDLMPYNGKYTLTIKRWSLGDEEWLDNPEAEHTNPKIEVEWNLINGLEAGVDYDITPVSVTPANNASIDFNNGGAMFRQMKIVFPDGTFVNPEIPIILSCDETHYSQELFFEGEQGKSSVTYTAVVSPAPLVSCNYIHIIPGGAFGDAEYVAGNGGHPCKPMTMLYAITGAQKEEGEDIETVTYDLLQIFTEIKKDGNLYTASMKWSSAPEIAAESVTECRLIDDLNFSGGGIRHAGIGRRLRQGDEYLLRRLARRGERLPPDSGTGYLRQPHMAYLRQEEGHGESAVLDALPPIGNDGMRQCRLRGNNRRDPPEHRLHLDGDPAPPRRHDRRY